MTLQTRKESDTFGFIEVPQNCYWGAQTQRSLENFKIGSDLMPSVLIRAFGLQKRACAEVNMALGFLDPQIGQAIIQASDEVSQGLWDAHFPLSVWQTGSGTQTHMNVNEVIANRAIELLGGVIGSKDPVHPNDHVNKSQSSNDSFPTVMHIATALEIHHSLLPSLKKMETVLKIKADSWKDVVKIGRTHLQDATPITFGQEFSAFSAQISDGIQRLEKTLPSLYALAQGGTAVGTGLNTHKNFSALFSEKISELTGLPFREASNKFQAIATHDVLVEVSSALNSLAVSCIKIANDIRLLGSGPRCGLKELILPANEPGSSIMPGKVNPTQAEALSMIAVQIMGSHMTVSISGSQGNLQLNTFKPVIIYNILQSIRILSDGALSFTINCLEKLTVNYEQVKTYVQECLMLVTALTPHIGYDKAANVAKRAQEKGLDLRQAALELGYVTEEEFSKWIRPQDMI